MKRIDTARLAEIESVASALRDANGAAADSKLDQLLQTTSPDYVPLLDERLRTLSGGYRPHALRWNDAIAERRVLATRNGPFLLLCEANGHRRQRALQSIGAIPHAIGLGLVMLRLNDWVGHVREEAIRTLQRASLKLDEDTRAACFGLFLGSDDWQRIEPNGRQILSRLFLPIAQHDNTIGCVIGQRSNHAPRWLRRALRTGVWDARLADIARTAVDPRCRHIALRALLSGEARWQRDGTQHRPISVAVERAALIDSGLSDAAPGVRRLAFDAYVRDLADQSDADKVLSRCLFDACEGLVTSAAFWVERRGGNPRELIRARLRTGEILPTSTLSYLGKAGDDADADAVLAIAHKNAGKRKWALFSAVATQDHAKLGEHIQTIAVGSDAAEAKRAVKVLLRRGWRLPHPVLVAWAARPAEFVDRRLMALAQREPPWQRAEIYLRLALEGDSIDWLRPYLDGLVEQSIRHWRPDQSERKILAGLLSALPNDKVEPFARVRWMLDTST